MTETQAEDTMAYPSRRPRGPPAARDLAVPKKRPVPMTPPMLVMVVVTGQEGGGGGAQLY